MIFYFHIILFLTYLPIVQIISKNIIKIIFNFNNIQF